MPFKQTARLNSSHAGDSTIRETVVLVTKSKALALTPLMIATLGAMAMLGPFGTDTYTPALPIIAGDMHVTMARVQLTLSAFTVGLAIGQFVAGSLSDRIGRRPVILGGGIVVAVASTIAAVTPTLEVLIAMCFLMGLTSAGGITGGRAVVADLVHGEAAGRPFGILGMMLSVGPIIGPVGGTILLTIFGNWRAIFVGMAVFAVLSTIAVWLTVPETLPHEKRHRGGLAVAFVNAGKVLANRQYLSHGLIMWLGFGLMFAYISSSTFVVQENLGLGPAAFSTSFAINGAVLVIISFITARLNATVGPKRLLMVGVCIQLFAVAALGIILATGQGSNPWIVFPELFFLAIPMGFMFGPVTALAMLEVRFAAGTAAALLGSLQFVAASITAALVGVVSSNPLVSIFVIGIAAEALLWGTLLLFAVLRRRANEQPTTR